MPIPNLIHPVVIGIKQINTSDTIYDENHREPIMQPVWSSEITVMGQPKFSSEEKKITISIGGNIVEAAGYILFRYVDLNARSLTLEGNERITRIGTKSYNFFIITLKPVALYDDIGDFTMVKAYFTDKKPKKK